MSDTQDTLIERLNRGALAYMSDSGPVYAGPTALEREAATEIEALEEECRLSMGVIAFERARAEAAEAEAAALRERLERAEKVLRGCQWYWPEDDTSEDCCAESAQEIVESAYGWSTPSGEVVAVARGGIVELTYCAALPPSDDSDSDDDFWVEEPTKEAAQAKVKAELDRRALQNKEQANG